MLPAGWQNRQRWLSLFNRAASVATNWKVGDAVGVF
jgi:hypothetical protein